MAGLPPLHSPGRGRLARFMAVLLALLSVADAQGEECPATVGSGGVWPEGEPMVSASAAPGPGTACCLFEWEEPTTFGTDEDLQALDIPTTGLLCTSAVTLGQLSEAFASGKVGQPETCTEPCDAWGPPPGKECCKAALAPGDSLDPPVDNSIMDYQTVPWVPVDLCPSEDSDGMLAGYDLTLQEPMGCPNATDVGQGTAQYIEFGKDLEEYFQGSVFALAFHRKLQLTPVTVTFSLTDAAGAVVMPEQTLVLESDSSRRRQLLKKSGGFSSSRSSSFSNSPSSSSSTFSSSSGGSSLSLPSSSSSVYSSTSGSSYSSKGTASWSSSASSSHYKNSAGYTVPFSKDLSSGSISQGTVMAGTGGGGVVYWGRSSPSLSTSSSSYAYYGAPSGFSNNWYSSSGSPFGSSYYGYSGPSRWYSSVPIILLSRPYGCGYSCYYYRSRYYQSTETEMEFRTLYLSCDMAMDLIMENAFKPSDYALPLTLKIASVDAQYDKTKGSCANNNGTAFNTASTPDSPALFATFVKMEEVESLSSTAARTATAWRTLAGLVAFYMAVLALFDLLSV